MGGRISLSVHKASVLSFLYENLRQFWLKIVEKNPNLIMPYTRNGQFIMLGELLKRQILKVIIFHQLHSSDRLEETSCISCLLVGKRR